MKVVDIIKKVVAVLTGFLTSCRYFIETNAVAELVEHGVGGLGSYSIGGDTPWMTIDSYQLTYSTFELLFFGNEGVGINWYFGLIEILKAGFIGTMLGLGVWVLITYCVDKWLHKKPDLH